jgi:hypothetical protein
MKPNIPGIWEWFDNKGIKKLVEVVNIRPDKNQPPYLRVYWWGGYYNVNDEEIGTIVEKYCKSEWPDRWGNRIADNNALPNDQLYLMPTKEEYVKITMSNRNPTNNL